MSKRIVYTIHAIQRVLQRNIPAELVVLCIDSPDKLLAENRVKKAVKKVDDKAIVVVYREEGNRCLVITAYITSKLKKYLA